MQNTLRVASVLAFLSCLHLSNSASTANAKSPGLYDGNDKVVILDNTNFNDSIIYQNYASLVEFYNSYCGHCRRFAPTYKELADTTWPWRGIVKVMAIDCAADENNGICREFEVMAYPTLRYFSPHFVTNGKDYGVPINSQIPSEILINVTEHVMHEEPPTEKWPNFSELTLDEASNLYQKLPDKVKYIVLLFQPTDASSIAGQIILTFSRYPEITIRRVVNSGIADQFGLSANHPLLAIEPNGISKFISTADSSLESLTAALHDFIKINDLSEEPSSSISESETHENSSDGNREIIAEVKRQKHLVYQADLEQAVRHIIRNEIPRRKIIKDSSLLSLQRLINVLKQYNPLGPNAQCMIDKLHEYTILNDEITGDEFQDKVEELETMYEPVYSSTRYIGCVGSKPIYRGFTCSLWTLFHYFTVQADANELQNDPHEVLAAIHGFVKDYFGCTDCAEHFQKMSTRRHIWSVKSKPEAVLWLWSAHNEVNNRLAGDETEDPLFPKLQFPSVDSCPNCRNHTNRSNSLPNETIWNRGIVLNFLRQIYKPANISRYGLDAPSVMDPQLEKSRQKRTAGNVFSEMDMKMGILLYGFCVAMMVLAFKLFAFQGHRKKPYFHEFIGKV